MDETISEDVKLFKIICTDLFDVQDEYSYEAICYKVLDTSYGDFCRSEKGVTLQEVGYIFGTTRERTRQIETTAIRKIRSPENESMKILDRYLSMTGEDVKTVKRYNKAIDRKIANKWGTNER